MRNTRGNASAILLGSSENVGFGRGLAEFRAGRPLRIIGGREALVALPVEGLDIHRFAAFKALSAPALPRLVITAKRARSLGIEADTPISLQMTRDTDVSTVMALVTEAKTRHVAPAEPAGPAAVAAIDLVKLAQVLPAVLVTDATHAGMFDPLMLTVEASAVAQFRAQSTQALTIAGEAHIPLNSGVRTRFVVFRDACGGGDPVAVIVGTPDFSKPVPVRLHSACMTGDVFGSRRCDCGDQLQLALTRLKEAGGGVILYLAQEGRGLGLANKMRTYKLQDAGLDTVDANTTLGFDDDERDYGIAVRMLQMLGCSRVLLMTNNPAKLDGLTKAGIEIAGRMPLETPINADNRRYMTAKASRAGHQLQLGHLINALSEQPAAETAAQVAQVASLVT